MRPLVELVSRSFMVRLKSFRRPLSDSSEATSRSPNDTNAGPIRRPEGIENHQFSRHEHRFSQLKVLPNGPGEGPI